MLDAVRGLHVVVAVDGDHGVAHVVEQRREVGGGQARRERAVVAGRMDQGIDAGDRRGQRVLLHDNSSRWGRCGGGIATVPACDEASARRVAPRLPRAGAMFQMQ